MGAVRRGSKKTGTDAENVGVEETCPRRPHCVVAEKIQRLEQEIDGIVMERVIQNIRSCS